MLRVGFDGRAFDSPAAGIRRYAHELVCALLAAPDPPQVVALGGNPSRLPDGVAHVPAPRHPPTNAGWTLVGLPWAAARAGLDVLHAPAYTAPFWAPVPVVLTIHDVSYHNHPEWYPYRRDWLRRAFYERSAHAATRIITVSRFSAGEIARAYGIDGARIAVAPLGVSRDLVEGPVGALPDQVRPPFVLHVGDVHLRRNLPVALAAVCQLRRRGGPRVSLVLAGGDRGVGDELRALGIREGEPDAVVLTGPVSEPQLRALYGGAVALVYPSRYEGFGLPLLEAMALGTPVLGARAASIPEVLGDGGLLLDPLATDSWADAIARVASDPDVAADLRARGRARAAAFTWARTAALTLDVYRAATAR